MDRLPDEELDGKCLFQETIRGRIADVYIEPGKGITVQSYNRVECPLPNGKSKAHFESADFWQWVEEQKLKVVDAVPNPYAKGELRYDIPDDLEGDTEESSGNLPQSTDAG